MKYYMSDLLPKIKEICQLFKISPQRSKGQNFLITESVYDYIVKAAEIKTTDTVLEVGPGLGFLTAKLAARAQQVIAVELDDQLAEYLRTGFNLQDESNVVIVNQDILKFNLANYLPSPKTPYKVVANLPYNITSFFLRQFLSSTHRPLSLILMLQKEVAERLTAAPPDMSLLAVSVQYYARPEILKIIKAGNFWPEPKVDSALVRLTVTKKDSSLETDKRFFRLVKIGFSAKRKMLKNNLAAGLKIAPLQLENILKASRLDPQLRAEKLSLADWEKLFAALQDFVV